MKYFIFALRLLLSLQLQKL